MNNEIHSKRSWLATLLLCIFLGELGIHRFYNGKIFSGLLMMVTGGGFGIWWIYDIIMIATKNFRDADGLFVID